ncbi:hypothetical protein CSC94_06420 [Zhengella mangrovi]|uniref:Fibronectin attachment protein n=1 Tax=Zhengella mangrovi TaxID=1982044 RepID=A0A2G1QS44_9HYPH|nr:hypothetical protein [Zhengella mangrovi]PHP68280.1 hypothetical protein CSC94_06420 [Zhengella mangrovi]
MLPISRPARFLSLVLSAAVLAWAATPAWSLSEIKKEEQSQEGSGKSEQAVPPPVVIEPVPLPSELPTLSNEPQPDGQPAEGTPDKDGGQANDIPLPEILRDVSALPEPVRRMRELIIEAAKTGDVEKLRPLLGTGDGMTTLSFGGVDGDPIEFLRGASGDGQGEEILAILEEVLEAGFVRSDAGTAQEMYVWPYFYAMPLDKLTPPQKVELFKLITAGDFEDMQNFGAYIFYRVGITPEGRWTFFVAGD